MRLSSVFFYPALAIVSSLMVLLTLSITPAGAFAIENLYWGSNNYDLPCAKQSYPLVFEPCTIGVDSSQLTLADWQNTANYAMSQWELHDSSDGHLIFQYQANAGLIVGVDAKPADLGGFNGNTISLGDTSWSYSGNFFAFVHIRINTNSAITWCTVQPAEPRVQRDQPLCALINRRP